MTGIPTLILWDVIVSVFVPKKIGSSKPLVTPGKTSTIGSVADVIDFVPLNVPPHIGNIRLYILEDNEPVISMVKKGRCPTMRHLSRTSRISSDWLFERVNGDDTLIIKYISTKLQIADILTKANFSVVQ